MSETAFKHVIRKLEGVSRYFFDLLSPNPSTTCHCYEGNESNAHNERDYDE
jgi:hypothetical protein